MLGLIKAIESKLSLGVEDLNADEYSELLETFRELTALYKDKLDKLEDQ